MELPELGTIFAGRYRIEALLGRGGFATVFRAFDTEKSRQVAVKVLDPQKAADPGIRVRFQREAQIVASLHDPHTIRFYDYGEAESGLLYIAFEVLPGENLAERLDREGTFSSEVVLRILDQLLSSLEEAHAAGLLHRDIKPDNVQVFERNRDQYFAKLLDFGIARLEDSGSPSLTKTGELIGTPRYMSPEQLAGRPLSPASDIYSLGMMVFELLVGREGLPGHHWGDQLERMRSGHVLSVPAMQEIDPQLMAVIHRMTARDPGDRIASAVAVRAALGAAPEPRREVAKSRPPAASPSSIWLVVGLVALAAAGVAAVIVVLAREEAPPDPVAPVVNPARVAALVGETSDATTADDAADDTGGVRSSDAGPSDASRTEYRRPRHSKGCGTLAPFDSTGTIDGALVVLPVNYDPDFPHPMVVLYHDDFQTPKQFARESGFLDIADRERVVLVAPKGGGKPLSPRNWIRPDLESERFPARQKAVGRKLCIDESRVFTVGNGEGASAAEMAACDSRVAATAANSFAYAKGGPLSVGMLACGRERASTPHISFVPVRSRQVPIESGRNCSGNLKIGSEEADEIKRQLHKCSGTETPMASTPPGVSCVTRSCKTEYISCETDGGYGWPGLPSPVYAVCDNVGPVDADLAGVTWEFFRRHQSR